VNAVTNFWFPQNAGNFLTTWKQVSFSRRTLLHAVINKSRFEGENADGRTNTLPIYI
jgi:hypothetical protein